jgi:hypothetical protein
MAASLKGLGLIETLFGSTDASISALLCFKNPKPVPSAVKLAEGSESNRGYS